MPPIRTNAGNATTGSRKSSPSRSTRKGRGNARSAGAAASSRSSRRFSPDIEESVASRSPDLRIFSHPEGSMEKRICNTMQRVAMSVLAVMIAWMMAPGARSEVVYAETRRRPDRVTFLFNVA